MHDVFERRQVAALAVRVVAVDVAAQHEFAFVRLADVEVHCARRDDRVEHRLYRLGDERLQHVRFDRQLEAGHGRDLPGMAGDREADFLGAYGAARGFDGGDAVAITFESRDFALLDDIYAESVRCARITPGHRIVARDAAAALQQPAHDRIARGG